MANLQLSLKKKWFEMTKVGIKSEDYREINSYWCSILLLENGIKRKREFWKSFDGEIRLHFINCLKNSLKVKKTYFIKIDTNTMTLGYPKLTDTDRILKFEHKGIEIGTGKPEWGAEPDKIYFIIKHGKLL